VNEMMAADLDLFKREVTLKNSGFTTFKQYE